MQNISTDPLATPVYLKTDVDDPWPEDKMFYLLTADGMFLCRNHAFFQSCAPAKTGPTHLAKQAAFCKPNYPLIPRVLIERAVGFFHLINEKKHWESALILVWNRETEKVELVCHDQKANGAKVEYEIPKLPPHQLVIGDLHCHMDWSPEPSYMDEHDEMNRPGLHIIVGKMQKEPPEFYACVVADGERFKVTKPKELFEDYIQRNTKDVPADWEAKVKEKKWEGGDYYMGGGHWGGYSGSGSGSEYHFGLDDPDSTDKEIVAGILKRWKEGGVCPHFDELRSSLFSATKKSSYRYCGQRAQKFIDDWAKKEDKHEDAHIGKE
jgi:hypothetical protein